MRLLTIASCVVLAGCATERGNIRHAQHAEDQIKMVQVQREAMVREAQADAQSNTALVEALAVIGVRAADSGDDSAPVLSLQQQRNEALEWTKALAPTVGNLVTGLGVAAIQADVTKTQSDNAARVQINDAESDVSIVQAVAGLGTAAANSIGVEVGGDYYAVQDQGVIDQSVTETTTTTTTTDVSLNTTLNYDGSGMTLGELIEQLQSAGASYSIDLDGDGTPDVTGEGEGESLIINCNSPQFSPLPPECWGA